MPSEIGPRRDHAAGLIQRDIAQLGRRVHRMLPDDARRMTDTLDILSTLGRRVDTAILTGKLRARNERQFFAFVNSVIDLSVKEKLRGSVALTVRERHAARTGERRVVLDGSTRMEVLERVGEAGRHVSHPIDREIAMHIANGKTFEEMAIAMGVSSDRLRQRWRRLKLAAQERKSEPGGAP